MPWLNSLSAVMSGLMTWAVVPVPRTSPTAWPSRYAWRTPFESDLLGGKQMLQIRSIHRLDQIEIGLVDAARRHGGSVLSASRVGAEALTDRKSTRLNSSHR